MRTNRREEKRREGEKKKKKKRKRRRREEKKKGRAKRYGTMTMSMDSNIKDGILKFCMNFHAIVWLVACPQT